MKQVEKPVVQDLDLAHRTVARMDLDRFVVGCDLDGLDVEGRAAARAEVEDVALKDVEDARQFRVSRWLLERFGACGVGQLQERDEVPALPTHRGE